MLYTLANLILISVGVLILFYMFFLRTRATSTQKTVVLYSCVYLMLIQIGLRIIDYIQKEKYYRLLLYVPLVVFWLYLLLSERKRDKESDTSEEA